MCLGSAERELLVNHTFLLCFSPTHLLLHNIIPIIKNSRDRTTTLFTIPNDVCIAFSSFLERANEPRSYLPPHDNNLRRLHSRHDTDQVEHNTHAMSSLNIDGRYLTQLDALAESNGYDTPRVPSYDSESMPSISNGRTLTNWTRSLPPLR